MHEQQGVKLGSATPGGNQRSSQQKSGKSCTGLHAAQPSISIQGVGSLWPCIAAVLTVDMPALKYQGHCSAPARLLGAAGTIKAEAAALLAGLLVAAGLYFHSRSTAAAAQASRGPMEIT